MVQPYCIGSPQWNGLSKLIEEAGEVVQVAGKIIGAEGETVHFDGSNLRERLESELGDLKAAIDFVINLNALRATVVERQRVKKLALFDQWNSGLQAKETA